jgi:hypothetical protein
MRVAEGQVGQNIFVGDTGTLGLQKFENPVQVIAGHDNVIGNEIHEAAPKFRVCVKSSAMPIIAQKASCGGSPSLTLTDMKPKRKSNAVNWTRRPMHCLTPRSAG